jgi:pantetheine-phosphate adenylyltransferase
VSSEIAIYAGSFDPPTNGHLDLVERASQLFPKVIVALGKHPSRSALFTVRERLDLLERLCAGFDNVEVAAFDGLLVDFARRVGGRVIVRGLRAAMDFEYELQIAHANADLAPEIDTVFLPTRTHYGFISASLVREISRHGGDVSGYASVEVCQALQEKHERQRRASQRPQEDEAGES